MNKKYYGFIYITTNLINGKKYIGQKKYDTGSRWKSYLGSGLHLGKAIKKYGKENFEREIIDYAYTADELNKLENKYINEHNAVESDLYYNAIQGGDVSQELSFRNSMPIINIDTGYVFKSIRDASLWSGMTTTRIKESFMYKNNDCKIDYLLFRKLSDYSLGEIPCVVCGSPIVKKNKFCKKCNNKKLNKDSYKKHILNKTKECHLINENWVLDYINSSENTFVKCELKVLNRPLSKKINKLGTFKKDYDVDSILNDYINLKLNMNQVCIRNNVNYGKLNRILKDNNVKLRPKEYSNYEINKNYINYCKLINEYNRTIYFKHYFEAYYYVKINYELKIKKEDLLLIVNEGSKLGFTIHLIDEVEFKENESTYKTLDEY